MLSFKQSKSGFLYHLTNLSLLWSAIYQPLSVLFVKKSPAAVCLPAALGNESYLPGLDGLRAIAVLIVLVAHFGLGAVIPGGFGVMLFFFISGFLITRLLMAEYHKTGSLHLKRFYIRRLIRLYPPLLLMLIIFPASLLLLHHTLAWRELVAVLLYLENYYLVYFPGSHTLTGYFNIFWSLAVEEHFYLVYPVLFLLFYKSKNFKAIILCLIAAALVLRLSYVLRFESPLLTGFHDPSYEPTYMLSHCRFDSILFGCLSALLINSGHKLYSRLSNNLLVFGLSLALILFTFISRDDFFRNSFRYTLQGIALMAMVPAVLLYPKYAVLNRLLSARWLVLVGKLSYSLYIMHWVGIMLAGGLYPGKPLMYLDVIKPWPWYLVSIPVTIGLTLFSYYVVERKFITLRRKYGSIAK